MRRLGRWSIVVGIVLLAAIPNLPYPLHGDQALFLIDGELLASGKLPYRDFWDLKQPGVFAFDAVAGSVFGFHETGLHLAELICWLAFAVLLWRTWPTLSGRGPSIWPVALIPVWYYAVTGSMQQTQVEAMVGPILYAQLWLLNRSRPGRWPHWALAGVLFAATILLKFLFAPMGLWIWLWTVWRMPWRESLRLSVAFAVGGLLTLAAATAPFVYQGEWEVVRRTFFEYPPRMMAELPPTSLSRLVTAFQWFVVRYSPVLGLAMIGTVVHWRTDGRRWLGLLFGWMVLATAIVVVQRLSWWNYHLLLLAVPVGLLAATGAQAIALGEMFGRLGPSARCGLLLVAIGPAIAAIGLKAIPYLKHRGAVSTADRLAYLDAEDQTYHKAMASSRFLDSPDARPGSIFVVGTPVVHLVSGRPQATVIHGWAMELYVPELREKLVQELRDRKPVYVCIQQTEAGLVRHDYPAMTQFLAERYTIRSTDDFGTWYEVKD